MHGTGPVVRMRQMYVMVLIFMIGVLLFFGLIDILNAGILGGIGNNQQILLVLLACLPISLALFFAVYVQMQKRLHADEQDEITRG